MSQYEYARDGRTDAEYKANFEAGTHNQRVVMEAYVAEKYYLENDDSWDYEETADKEFSAEWGEYQPDYTLTYKGKPIACEVKTQVSPLREYIYLKQNQVSQLLPVSGVVLYATSKQYFVLPAAEWAKLPKATKFDKPCYQARVADMPWRKWRYPLVTLKK